MAGAFIAARRMKPSYTIAFSQDEPLDADAVMPRKDILLDLVVRRRCVSAAGVIWSKRRAVVTHDFIKFSRLPPEDIVLEDIPLLDVQSVECQCLVHDKELNDGAIISVEADVENQRSLHFSDDATARGWIYKKGQVRHASLRPLSCMGVGADLTWIITQVTNAYQRRYFELQQGRLVWFLPSQVSEAGVVTGHARGTLSTSGLTIEVAGNGPARHFFAVSGKEGSSTRRIEMACHSYEERQSWVEALRHMAAKQHAIGHSPEPMVERARKRDQVNSLVKSHTASFNEIMSMARGQQNYQRRTPVPRGEEEEHECLVCLKCGDDENRKTLILSADSVHEGQVFVDVVRNMSRDQQELVQKQALQDATFMARLQVGAFQYYHSKPVQVVSNSLIFLAFCVTVVEAQIDPADNSALNDTILRLEIIFAVGYICVCAHTAGLFLLALTALSSRSLLVSSCLFSS